MFSRSNRYIIDFHSFNQTFEKLWSRSRRKHFSEQQFSSKHFNTTHLQIQNNKNSKASQVRVWWTFKQQNPTEKTAIFFKTIKINTNKTEQFLLDSPTLKNLSNPRLVICWFTLRQGEFELQNTGEVMKVKLASSAVRHVSTVQGQFYILDWNRAP